MTIYRFAVAMVMLFTSAIYAQNVWNQQNSGVSNVLYEVQFVDENSGWICGHGGVILHTSNGGIDWESQSVPPSNFYGTIFFTDSLTGWSAGYASRIIHTLNGGTSWSLQSTPTDYGISDIFFTDGNTGWTVGGKARTFTDPIKEIMHTTDGGNTWSLQYSGSNEDPLAAVYFLDDQNGWAVGNTSTIMHTTNGGNNWNFQMTGPGYQFGDVFFINENTGWVVGEDLSLNHYAVIFKTTDGGANWDFQTFPSGQSFQAVQFINESTGWVVGGDNDNAYILNTTDGGTNWTYQDAGTNNFLSSVCFPDGINGWAVGFDGTIVHTQYVVPVELTSFNAAVDQGNVNLIWETSTETNNSGFEIQRAADKNKYEQVGFVQGSGTTTKSKQYSYVDKNLSRGVYSYRLVQVDFDGTRQILHAVNVEISNTVPEGYTLFQNYPNPFNPTTTIKYSIPSDGNVNLKIYNSAGEEVSTLINEFKTAGNHKISFNARKLASGVYYYRLQTDAFSSTKKMLLLK